MSKILSALLLVALLTLPAVAQELPAMETDRPDFTEGTQTVPPGHFQVEAGATFADSDGVDERSVGETLFRIGLAERLELRVGAGSHLRSEAGPVTAEGYGDTSLGLKWGWTENRGGRPASSLLVTAGLPWGDSEVTGDDVEPSAVVALAWELAPGTGLGVNLGWERPEGDDGDSFDAFLASAAVGWELPADGWGLFVEAYGFSREEPGGDPTVYADAGVTFSPRPGLQFDLRLGANLEGPDQTFVGVGFAWRR